MDEPRDSHERTKPNRGEIPHDIPYRQNLKRNDTNELIHRAETDSQRGRMGGKDS